MFRERARLFTSLQFISDLILTLIAFPLAYQTRLRLSDFIPAQFDPFINPALHALTQYLWIVSLAIPWWAACAYSLGLYRISMRRLDWQKLRVVLECAILLGLFLGFLSFALKLNLSRSLFFIFVLYQVLFLVGARLVLGFRRRATSDPSLAYRNLLIVGDGAKAQEMGRLVARYADWGLRVLGYVSFEKGVAAPGCASAEVLGTVADIPGIVESRVVDEILVVGSEPRDLACLEEVLSVCREQGIPARLAVDFFPAKVSKAAMEFIENVPIISFSAAPDHPVSLFLKRSMDVILSAGLLLVLFPVMVLVGLAVRLSSRGPMIYQQVRCGLYGRRFVLYKFRSMREGAEDVLWEIKHLNEMDGPVFKMRNDPRVTPLGRLLRKSSIDEWPQFWNVLRGEMSLVGPRAPLPEEVREYTRWQRRRLSVKPGITCLWQVSGRNEIDFHEWMKLDLHYIDNWSLFLDLKILLRTFPVVLLGKGAR